MLTMPSMPPDAHKISLKIIEAIEQHPVLYISEVKGGAIKLQEFRQKVWKRIALELGLDPGWVRLRWKNLRDTYCRILKYKNKTDKGIRRKKWVFEDHLSFLKFPYESDYQPQCVELSEEYIQDINAGDNNTEGLLEQLEDRTDDDFTEYLEVLEETTADPILDESEDQKIEMLEDSNSFQQIANSNEMQQVIVTTPIQQIESKFRKIRPKRAKYEHQPTVDVSNTYSILKNSNQNTGNLIIPSTSANGSTTGPIFLRNSTVLPTPVSPTKNANDIKLTETNIDQVYLAPEGKSSIELFFDSMAETVKKLPAKAQADIKMEICKLVTEAEVKYSGQTSTQNTQQFIAPPGMIPKLVLIPCSMIDNANNKG
ncbi:uncharacterized protein LOC124412710 [Diprion similis]|uniref:uncharacterized protein LOC124412710 n=1 Tax=Diprion similis TaxID=362088 RepID=UPI001EF8DA43|nr:uncharacterized protein LOC124412710 [Diprion similis]